MTGQTVLVTGGTGAIGPALVTALVGAGAHVRALVRPSSDVRRLPAKVELVAGDLEVPETLRRAVECADVVFHLAAHLHVPSPTLDDRDRYTRVNVDATESFAAIAASAGVERMVYFSTIAVYGPAAGLIDEATPPRPETLYGASKLDGEQRVLALRTRSGAPLASVLRLAAVYGPHVKGNYRRLVSALHRRRFVPIGRGGNHRTLVHDADVAAAALRVATRPAAAGRIYNVTDGSWHTLAAIIEAICTALGRHPPRVRVPLWPVRAAAAVADAGGSLLGRRPRFGAAIDTYSESLRVSATRIHEVGFSPAYDLDSGWRATIAAMREAGELR